MTPNSLDLVVVGLVRTPTNEAQRLLADAQKLIGADGGDGQSEATRLIFAARMWLWTIEKAMDLAETDPPGRCPSEP